jgi:chromosome segregation ATPase
MTLFLVGFLEALIVIAVLVFFLRRGQASVVDVTDRLMAQLEQKKELRVRFQALVENMVPISSLRKTAAELKTVQESIKTERGRITITRAELETVENRLRELEEIERELEASNIETNHEAGILKKRHNDLSKKTAAFGERLEEILKFVNDMTFSCPEAEEINKEVSSIEAELRQSQEKLNELISEVQKMSQHYATGKGKYDALDIEYAQLYEKFAENENALAGKKLQTASNKLSK